ncbi:hypothetical protein QQ045_010627 [Rhodiola kirilowii]
MASGKDMLFVIPAPGFGHLGSILEMVKKLNRPDDNRFSITFLIISFPFCNESELVKKLSSSNPDFNFVDIPLSNSAPEVISGPTGSSYISHINSHKQNVLEVVKKQLLTTSKTDKFCFIVDMFCGSMVEVANELGVGCYSYFISGAAFVGLCRFIAARSEVGGPGPDWIVPSYVNPVPTSCLPRPVLDLSGTNHVSETNQAERTRILSWLDEQKNESVVFLCFGRQGCFKAEQVKEMALGLELSGVKILWALKKQVTPGPGGSESDDLNNILPEGFLMRIGAQGIICGWAPQLEILAHPAVGGFVTHCGMQSILESSWFGVPTASWPLYAEQQMNALLLANDLKLSVEIKIDYKINQEELVPAHVSFRARSNI